MCGQAIAPKKLDEITSRIAAEKDKEYSQRFRTDLQKAIDSATREIRARANAAEEELKIFRANEQRLLEREQALTFQKEELELEVQRRITETHQKVVMDTVRKTEATYSDKLHEKGAIIARMEAQVRQSEFQEAELKRYRDKETDLQKREESLTAREQTIQTEITRCVDETYSKRVATDIQKAVESTTRELRAKASTAEEELKRFRATEQRLLEREQALTFQKEELELEVQRRLATAQDQLINQVTNKVESRYAYRLQEKDKAITDMQAKLQEAQAKAEAAGAQARGGLQETDILERLKALHPNDVIDQVARSRGGADILHVVRNLEQKPVGSILWESKHSQNWSESWLIKLREDQRKVSADVAVLVSNILPNDQPGGGLREGILVLGPDTFEEVAPVLRQYLINLYQQKAMGQLQDEKAQRILEYLSGKEFNLILTGVVEDINAFRDLDEKEERFVLRAVAQRRELQQRSTRRLARMFGTLQGIMGSLPEVPGLQLIEPPINAVPTNRNIEDPAQEKTSLETVTT